MIVRPEARASLLAYAYLRGRPLDSLERPGSRSPDWDNVRRIAKRFSGPVSFDEAALKTWAKLEEPIKLSRQPAAGTKQLFGAK